MRKTKGAPAQQIKALVESLRLAMEDAGTKPRPVKALQNEFMNRCRNAGFNDIPTDKKTWEGVAKDLAMIVENADGIVQAYVNNKSAIDSAIKNSGAVNEASKDPFDDFEKYMSKLITKGANFFLIAAIVTAALKIDMIQQSPYGRLGVPGVAAWFVYKYVYKGLSPAKFGPAIKKGMDTSLMTLLVSLGGSAVIDALNHVTENVDWSTIAKELGVMFGGVAADTLHENAEEADAFEREMRSEGISKSEVQQNWKKITKLSMKAIDATAEIAGIFGTMASALKLDENDIADFIERASRSTVKEGWSPSHPSGDDDDNSGGSSGHEEEYEDANREWQYKNWLKAYNEAKKHIDNYVSPYLAAAAIIGISASILRYVVVRSKTSVAHDAYAFMNPGANHPHDGDAAFAMVIIGIGALAWYKGKMRPAKMKEALFLAFVSGVLPFVLRGNPGVASDLASIMDDVIAASGPVTQKIVERVLAMLRALLFG